MSLTAPQPEAPPSDSRSLEILAGARRAFARKGFDGTSMQDLAREAGMSVGNFYRYFPSKTAIVEAMINHNIAEIEAEFEAAFALGHDPLETLRQGIRAHIAAITPEENCIRAEVSAAALRQSDVATTCRRMEERIGICMITAFSRITGLSEPECEARFGGHARYLLLVIKTAKLRSADAPDPDLDRLVLRGIDVILDEIATHRPEGALHPAGA